MSMDVRIAQPRDLEQVMEVFASQGGPGAASKARSLWDVWMQSSTGHALVAQETSGVLLGFAHLALHQQREGWLEDLVVHKDYQRRGTGAALVQYAQETLAKAGGQRLGLDVFSDNARALRLYDHLGFREVLRYIRMDGSFESAEDDKAQHLSSHPDLTVEPPTAEDAPSIGHILTPQLSASGWRMARTHHKFFCFDRTDLDDFMRSEQMLIARHTVTGVVVGVMLFQNARLWRDDDRIIDSSAPMSRQDAGLRRIVVINLMATAPIIPEELAQATIAQSLLSALLSAARQQGASRMRAYPQTDRVFDIDLLRRAGLVIPEWEAQQERSFLVLARGWI